MKISIKARPNSKEEKIEKIDDFNFVVCVKEPPREGRANAAILKKLAEYFNVSISQIRIISGYASRNKTIQIV